MEAKNIRQIVIYISSFLRKFMLVEIYHSKATFIIAVHTGGAT